MTILNKKDLAHHLNIKVRAVDYLLKKDRNFPRMKVFGTTRFIKEKVDDYLEFKKKIDVIPSKYIKTEILLKVRTLYQNQTLLY
jgi:predicted DNA-binding transcriptional regulator AlpA